ncbi:MAG: hypothetical protein H8E44_38480 [Planctomycetes bacterium]|nr:hypothetical protein [Planctomycetota bacterium]MBL7039185.1 hypothetical protein [Pirellulaceae bacterium]
MAESLSSVLSRMRIESLLEQAMFIRDCSKSDCYSFEMRTKEARKLIHAVLYDSALGKIGEEDRRRILGILHFARTSCVIRTEEPIATYQDEEVVAETDRPKKQQTFFFMP